MWELGMIFGPALRFRPPMGLCGALGRYSSTALTAPPRFPVRPVKRKMQAAGYQIRRPSRRTRARPLHWGWTGPVSLLQGGNSWLALGPDGASSAAPPAPPFDRVLRRFPSREVAG